MKYKVLSQNQLDERIFNLEDENGYTWSVDIFTDGQLPYLEKEEEYNDMGKFDKWLKSFVGKTLEIQEIRPLYYVTSGEISIVSPLTKE